MELKETGILGCYELFPRIFKDDRGKLIKTFHQDTFINLGLAVNFTEEYYSVSAKGVLRGLHFQTPPHEHIKCVTCLSGQLFDVVVDLRRNSPSYGEHFFTELSSEKGNMVYIPAGCAHGFYALTDQAIFLNKTTSVFSAESDAGIRWDSCGIPWPDKYPILSEKDCNMLAFQDFSSPFIF
jgi:dTDP-4-dehydrorhamnose 3,5-epimerase